ncbi:DUF2806 domain-containing protein [Leisingera caerulea]|uniref:DUF2806 domain-containing protein n=1 Tax=Leisingera caerulea TaxID=506591 RepID=A0A9Q9HIZ4_LEICA|nr:DUF2806 domain-containing protein [Leisingera caerulea]UWQ55994.1 DUF2806 domain-containing protein [Leisingera caerulea]
MVARPIRGERVVELMSAPGGRYAGVTLQDFADASLAASKEAGGKDFSKPKLEAIRGGRGNTSVGIARTLAHMLDCSAAYLFGDTDDPRPETLSATAIAQQLAQMPTREIERFFEHVAAHLIDFRPEPRGRGEEGEDTPLLANVRAGKVSPDPDAMEVFWDSIPRFYKREEARMRGIVFNAAAFERGRTGQEEGQPGESGDESHSPSAEWLDAFRRHAPTATNGVMADLWAGILWYEFRHPGSIAIRTLMAIPAMSEQVFRNLMKFSGALIRFETKSGELEGEYYIRPNDDKGPNFYLAMFGLQYDNMLELEEYGLVRLAHRDLAVEANTRLVYGSGTEMWAMDVRQKVKVRVNALTEVARDLRPLYQGRPEEDYLKGVRNGMRSFTAPYKPWRRKP